MLELEDNVYKIEQNINNCEMFKKIFISIANLMKLKLDVKKKIDKPKRGFGFQKEMKKITQKILSEHSKTNSESSVESFSSFDIEALIRGFVSSSHSTFYSIDEFANSSDDVNRNKASDKRKKTNAKDLRRKMFLNKLIRYLQDNDLIFLLNKIKIKESKFCLFKFLSKQNDSKVTDLDLKYTFDNGISLNESLNHVISGNSQVKSDLLSFNEQDLMNSDSFYEKLINCVSIHNLQTQSFKIKINLNKHQYDCISQYIETNLHIINQRIINLQQQKKIKFKEKNQTTQHANDFFYDQQIINQLTTNYNKVEDFTICNVFKLLEEKEDDESNTIFNVCYTYNQIYDYGMEPKSDDISRKLLSTLQ